MKTRDTYDPFSWRLHELARPDLNPLRRAELLDDLLVAEAEEIVVGRRHLTIVHGEPSDLAEVEELNVFYDMVSVILDSAEWARLSGSDDYLTVTVGGRGRDELLERVVDLSRELSPAPSQILDTPARLLK